MDRNWNNIKNIAMEKVSNQQIICVFQGDNDIVIFDEDHWADQRKQKGTEKDISTPSISGKQNYSFVQEIEKEIKNTQENFYQVKVVKEENKSNKDKNLPKIQSPNTIIIEGFMEKKTDGFFFTWHKRYMVLTSQKLYSFEDQSKKRVIGCVNLKILPAKLEESSEGILLNFIGECQNLILKAPSINSQSEWKNAIKNVLQYNFKERKLLLTTMSKPFYDSIDSLTEKQFLKTAETGDILLFHTENNSAKIQRVITGSDFDHVAMIIKFKKRQLMVFQSNQMHGVSLYSWDKYIKYFDLYQKVVMRKLNYVRKTDAQTTIMNFVRKNIGKSYDLSFQKLLKFQSDFNWEQVKEDRGYFCSELVAKVLKSLGLLDVKKSSGRYWPVDFSEKNNLQLKRGASLGAEQAIILAKHTKRII